MNLVVDASIAVEYLLRSRIGKRLEAQLATAPLFAPEVLDAEVLAVLRRLVLQRRLDDKRGAQAVADLRDWPLERIGHRDLATIAWSLRNNVTAYDAFYLAAARLTDAAILTADGPLSRVTLAGFTIQNISLR